MIDTYTPILWATMTEDEKYGEYIRLRQSQEWQLIETAPKDGTWILAYGIDGTVRRVSWGKTRNDGVQWCTPNGWCEFRYLTHWIPDPAKP